jgi:hypothetical protein
MKIRSFRGELQISPLRYAPVEMTKGRAVTCLPIRYEEQWEGAFYLSIGFRNLSRGV